MADPLNAVALVLAIVAVLYALRLLSRLLP